MQILIPDSWLREYLKTKATPKQIQEALSLCSASVERLHQTKDDFVYDIEVTTNRVDLMSVIGIAQEAAAVLPQFGHPAKLIKNPLLEKPEVKMAKAVDYLKVQVDSKLCPRFTAVLIKGVTVKPSPQWLVKKLELAGMRGLNNVVDISNYLMHLIGQPVHTFDWDKITNHTMILRESKPGEKVTTIDKKSHTLGGGEIVIADGSLRLIDMCGIMGGLNSAVDERTQNVLLFVQTYEPVHIRKTSMSQAQRSAAAVLFEKGLPTENVPPTLNLGINLFKELTGGKPEPVAIDLATPPKKEAPIKLDVQFVNRRLGINLSAAAISKILVSLGFGVNNLQVSVPPRRRLDVVLAEDLVEEVARVYGYHNLPSILMTGSLPEAVHNQTFYWESQIKSALSHWGFTETYTYSLMVQDSGLKLKNPLSSEWAYLRTSLVPSHLLTVTENLGRVKEINLFEIANIYLPRKGDLPQERLHLIITTTNLDIPRLKGIVEAVFNWELGIKVEFNFGREVNLHTSPSCLTYEIDLTEVLPQAKADKTYVPISKFSPVIEDVNIRYQGNYDQLLTQLKKISHLISVIEMVDIYEDKLTLRITYHSAAKQLSSADVAVVRDKIMELG
ncbi:MAG: phenylalanine--tRNA ligase subunit beta [bacterium]|nr:phenylalanine--tRNA ligase subunit beta [bacterium]